MKKLVLLALLAMPVAAQSFDVKLLDRLGANASNATTVTLNKTMLRLASNFLGDDDDSKSVRALVRNLNAIYVRVYAFNKPGQFNEADLAPMRAMLTAPKWDRIVETKSSRDNSEVYVQPLPNDLLGGVAIISIEPMEVTVIYIDGTMSPQDIGKLSGTMGIPDIKPMIGMPRTPKK
ncbi:MAG: DUF4252 domain-containing protein [Terriglobia bacterium]